MSRIISCLVLLLLLDGAVEAEESPRRTIQGRWTHDGKPMVDGTINLRGSVLRRETVSDADGRFVFDDLGPGRYKLQVDLLGDEGLERERGIRGVRGGFVRKRVRLGSQDVTTELVTYSTSISGYIRDAAGAPVRVALLWLEPPGKPPNSWTGEWCRPSDLSDADGYFEIRGVPPGSYRLLARTRELAPAWKWIELTPEQSSIRQDLRLDKPSPFDFRALGPDGKVPTEIYITLTDADNRTLVGTILKPAYDGTFSVNAPAGHWRLWLRGGQTATISFEIQAPGKGGTWSLPALGRIRIEGYEETGLLAVRLLDADGQPYYRVAGGLLDGQIPYRSAVRAPAGQWTVEVSGPDGFHWLGEVEVVAEEEALIRMPAAD